MSVTKRVLSIGQCVADDWHLKRLVTRQLGTEFEAASGWREAEPAIARGDIGLVLVNRLLDRDRSPGVEVIKSLKAHADGAAIPVMLVSNFPEAQEEAVAHGALPGFGKAHLESPETLEKLRAALTRERENEKEKG